MFESFDKLPLSIFWHIASNLSNDKKAVLNLLHANRSCWKNIYLSCFLKKLRLSYIHDFPNLTKKLFSSLPRDVIVDTIVIFDIDNEDSKDPAPDLECKHQKSAIIDAFRHERVVDNVKTIIIEKGEILQLTPLLKLLSETFEDHDVRFIGMGK